MSSIQAIFSGLRNVGAVPIWAGPTDGNVIAAIHSRRAELAHCTDAEVTQRASALHAQGKGGPANRVMAGEAFGLLDEAAFRTMGIRFYDVQFTAALAMLRNEIVEMKTGEGKTFVGALASVAHAMAGRNVHFMTTNAYLAKRDHEIVAEIFRRIGVSVGLIDQNLSRHEKRAAYDCDVIYGPGYEFGFDYLRDQLALIERRRPRLGERVQTQRRHESETADVSMQRERGVAIVDEADSVLLDDATTPLILSSATGSPNPNPESYLLADSRSRLLTYDQHYRVDTQNRRVVLTSAGQEEVLGNPLDDDVRQQLRRPWSRYVENALSASHFFARDAQYIIVDQQVCIVDANTGRVFEDRTWSEGLHQAVEAKEGLEITEESSALARITRQQYFRLYAHVCGMTGTAVGGKRELRQVYRLSVTVVPTHRPCQRIEEPMRFFVSESEKFSAICDCVRRVHASGQPVLIGTRTIDKSEAIAARLEDLTVRLLNGKQDADEASLVAKAGEFGAITIATNMAGRGTDIKLGSGVTSLGGLFVIVSEPHESARVDRQLMGRAARQGDPGASQVFVSADDELIVRHAPWLSRLMKRIANADGEVRASLHHEIVRLQHRVERKAAATRRKMFSREHWLEDTLSKLANENAQ